MWTHFNDGELRDIVFHSFSTENTYRLIDRELMTSVVKKIIEEIVNEEKEGYKNLKSD